MKEFMLVVLITIYNPEVGVHTEAQEAFDPVPTLEECRSKSILREAAIHSMVLQWKARLIKFEAACVEVEEKQK